MSTLPHRAKVCAVMLVAVAVLLAPLHLCANLNACGNSHPCPVCSTTTTAIATDVPVLGIAPAVTRLEISRPQIETATTVPISISPRAPPPYSFRTF